MAGPGKLRTLVVISLVTILLGVPILVAGSWLASRHHVDCLSFLAGPIVFIGLATMLVGLLGLVGARRAHRLLMLAYLLLLFLLLLLLLSFTLFAFFVTGGGGGHPVRSASFYEYHLSDFSIWFQDQTTSATNWPNLRACLQDRRECNDLNRLYPTHESFYNANLSPVQSGCCKPPLSCGYSFVTPTHWDNVTSGSINADCGQWDNDSSQLCYACNSCRAGLLEDVRDDWIIVAKICLAALILLAILYFVAWVIFLRALWDHDFQSAPHHPGYSQTHV